MTHYLPSVANSRNRVRLIIREGHKHSPIVGGKLVNSGNPKESPPSSSQRGRLWTLGCRGLALARRSSGRKHPISQKLIPPPGRKSPSLPPPSPSGNNHTHFSFLSLSSQSLPKKPKLNVSCSTGLPVQRVSPIWCVLDHEAFWKQGQLSHHRAVGWGQRTGAVLVPAWRLCFRSCCEQASSCSAAPTQP